MNPDTAQLLDTLLAFGQANDRKASNKSEKMLNITKDTGEFLAAMIQATRARNVLEIGTSNGYSTVWLADAVGSNGRITTLDITAEKTRLATENLAQAGYLDRVSLLTTHAEDFLADHHTPQFDLIFLDADRSQYTDWWPLLKKVLVPCGTIIVDNAISHAEELAAFTALIQAEPAVTQALVPVGKGERIIVISGDA
ncbi:O-methyltransferase [Photobacterium atrarenae]|uniref:Class I SAM-dependent methyltransferase n=1 Tax=Photobacterium atrarenae TaxID=865757 RepID=A0ABY5GMW4_9GAMM|nr:class I SAM-dependent methyltransferase [Photobacterium atrarenae]UTV30664.1 class I SAM-dependent methyltransferase [Photobacterium atrarenae]